MSARMPSYPASTTPAGLVATLPINKIVVVGHPLSGFEGVESLLIRCGMQAAAPSQREGLSAADIGATLLKAHRVIPLDAMQTHGPIQALQPGPIWQSLALDLLLGNINHDLWGWSDPQAVYLLDYWKNLDPQLAFMLVYDTPQDLIARAFDNPDVECTPEALQTAVDNWQAYNEALLHFYHRNPQRCMLVHAAQVRESAADYLQQVQARIGAPLGIASEAKSACMAPVCPDTESTLRRYLAQHILGAQPQALTLYQELQAVASLPHSAPTTTDQQPHAASLALAALQTLKQVHTTAQAEKTKAEAEAARARADAEALQAAASRAQAQSNELQQENDLLLTQLHPVQEELERYHLENQRLKQAHTTAQAEKTKAEAEVARARADAEAFQAEASRAQAQSNELQQENDLLLTQLHPVQEELERYHLENQRLKQAHTTAQEEKTKAEAEAAKARADAEALQAAASRAPQAQSNELQQENDLLLAQLHPVQEELERYYLENQRLKSKPSAPAKPAQAPAPYGAVEYVKQQLSYQLGSKMIERSRSLRGWLGMPFALVGVARQYKRELPQRKAVKQIPLEQYRDAYEAERVKQHLSYRLGAALIKHGKNPLRWPALPFALKKARQDWLHHQAR